MNSQQWILPGPSDAAVKATLETWRRAGNVQRLWAGDAGLWTGKDEACWLGWLDIVERQLQQTPRLQKMSEEIAGQGFSHALLLGMGGSSLGAEVLAATFRSRQGYPILLVLDSTDPAQIRSFEEQIDLTRTLFIVSSKSGSTLEPNILKQYFFTRVAAVVGEKNAGTRFVAITDPGSKLQEIAKHDRFGQIAFGDPSIGGRYSVLSDFGMVPAAAMGLDTGKFLGLAQALVRACAADVPAEDNPGLVLGVILGVLGGSGRDKITIVASAGIADFGGWLEQLLAESTGKHGRGLIPVADEPLGAPEVYGQDRVFVYLRLASEADPAQDKSMAALEKAGQPVVRISVTDREHIGQEFFRWEFATAVAGAILGINPFDQPDVEASKVKTRELTAAYEQSGEFPPEEPILTVNGIKIFADAGNAKTLGLAGCGTLVAALKAHFSRLEAGDYCALLAYVERNKFHHEALNNIRLMIRDCRRVATCLGFGPRFLHSTGQAYKGGPNTGVFLQITCDDAADLQVPGQKYSFGIVKAAEARGDFEVLAERGRRLLRVHLGSNVAEGLQTLGDAVRQALS